MNEQALRQLLVDADAAAGSAPSISHDLAGRVQKRLRRRRYSQVAGASVLLCAVLAVAMMMRTNPRPANVAQSSPAKMELALIRLEADSQAATVSRMIAYQKSLDRAVAARKFERGEPRERLQEQREKAARLLTQDGEYRRVIQLFPETRWATVARQRLQI
jgi:hypothetical protein